MAFADTISITRDGTAVVLSRMGSSDKYSSEYFFRDATNQYRLIIRHADEKKKVDGVFSTQMERHNISLTRTIFGTSTSPDIEENISVTIRFQKRASTDSASKTSAALAAYINAAISLKLINWES